MIERILRAHPAVVLIAFLGLIAAIPPVSGASGLSQEEVSSLAAIGYIAWLWAVAIWPTSAAFMTRRGLPPGVATAYLLFYFGLLVPFVLEPLDRSHRLGTHAQDVWHIACAAGLICVLHYAARGLATMGGARFRLASYFGFLIAVGAFPFGIWFIQRKVRSSRGGAQRTGARQQCTSG